MSGTDIQISTKRQDPLIDAIKTCKEVKTLISDVEQKLDCLIEYYKKHALAERYE